MIKNIIENKAALKHIIFPVLLASAGIYLGIMRENNFLLLISVMFLLNKFYKTSKL